MKEKDVSKKIRIFTESGLIETIDSDESPLEEYSKNLSKLLESSNVSILETSSGSLILRPSKISGIYISEEKILKESKKYSTMKVDKTEDVLMEE